MPDSGTLIVFFVWSLGILVVPGPAVLYIVARSVDQGRTAGLVSVLGVTTGSAVHIIAAALGLSAILMRSAAAFEIVKYAGAAYLVIIGIRKLMERDILVDETLPRRAHHLAIFRQGVVVNILNPKTAFFFFAFLPQFADPDRGPVGGQIMLLGIIFLVTALVSDGTYALLSARVGLLLRANLGFIRSLRWFAGSVYIALGLYTALIISRPSSS